MIEIETLKSLIGKPISFCWGNKDNTYFSYGILLDVKGNNIIVDFHGTLQYYDINTILYIREKTERDLKKRKKGFK